MAINSNVLKFPRAMMSPRPGYGLQAVARRFALIGLTILVGFLVLAPLLRLQRLALGHRSYARSLELPGVGAAVTTTIILALGSVLIAVPLGTVLAWMASRLPRRTRWMATLPVLPLVVPNIALIAGWAFLLSPNAGYLNQYLRRLPFIGGTTGPIDVYTRPWIIIIVGFSLSSFVYLFVRAGLQNMNGEFVEAAQVSGSSPTKAFVRTTLPLLRPVLIHSSTVVLVLGLGQLSAPLLLGSRNNVQVLTTFMYQQVSNTNADYGVAAALGTPLLLAGILAVWVQRMLIGDESRFRTSGGKSGRSSRQVSKLAPWVVGLYAVISVVLPLAALVVVALSPFWSGTIRPHFMSLQNFRTLFVNPLATHSMWNSIRFSLSAVAILLPLGFIIASVIFARRRNRFVAGALELITGIPLAVPAVIFGAGFLFTYSQAPFKIYGTSWVMILVYVTLMLPYTLRLQLSGIMTLGEHYEEASRTSGAGTIRTKVSVTLPMLRGHVAGAAVVMVILLSHEFSASLLVRSTQTQVMGTMLYDAWGDGSYPQVAAMALVMFAITAAGVVLAMMVGGRSVIDRI
jgi:iron(III) transport system permease protein